MDQRIDPNICPREDFLETAQWVKNPKIEIYRRPLIDDLSTKMVGFGSCFAQNIQRGLDRFGFDYWFERDICARFSSEALADMFEWVAAGRPHSEDDLFFFDDNREHVYPYRHYFYRFLYGPTAVAEALARLDDLDRECVRQLRECDHIVMTLGTSRVTRLVKNGVLINTVYGMPRSVWSSDVLSVADNVRHLNRMYESLRHIRGGRKMPTLFLTLSPQRYLFNVDRNNEDWFVDNMLGKCIVRAAISEFIGQHKSDEIVYFPAFEIVLEELRAFESINHYDFMHIEQAHTPEYVVKRFLESYCTDQILDQLELAENVFRLSPHIIDDLQTGLSPEDARIVKVLTPLVEEAERLGGVSCRRAEESLRTLIRALGRALERSEGGPAIRKMMDRLRACQHR